MKFVRGTEYLEKWNFVRELQFRFEICELI